MTKPANQITLTLERFLELEREAVQKHEFVDGQMYAMAGAPNQHKTRRHNLIVTNLVTAFNLAARATDVQVMSSDMQVVISAEPPVSYYPDVIAVCGYDGNEDFTTRPCLVIEVLAESTQRFDQNEKRWNYQRLESLKAYLIVHQDQKRIDVHRRTSSTEWTVENYEAGEITLECPNMVLKLEDVYESIGLL
jgi:Uma2 family endonuclease